MRKTIPPTCQLDDRGHLVRVGLSYMETKEFMALDASLPYDGKAVWPDRALPLPPMEARWLELWTKHRDALAAEMSDA